MAAFESKNEWPFCFKMSTVGPFFSNPLSTNPGNVQTNSNQEEMKKLK